MTVAVAVVAALALLTALPVGLGSGGLGSAAERAGPPITAVASGLHRIADGSVGHRVDRFGRSRGQASIGGWVLLIVVVALGLSARAGATGRLRTDARGPALAGPLVVVRRRGPPGAPTAPFTSR